MPPVDTDTPVPPERQQLIVNFLLDRQTYALPIESVVKIVEISSVAPLATVDDFVTGAIDVAGRLIPVVNMRACFGLPENWTWRTFSLLNKSRCGAYPPTAA